MDCLEKYKIDYEQIVILATTFISSFLLNYLLFGLAVILSLIYSLILSIVLFFYINPYIHDEELYGNGKEIFSIALMSESVILSFKEYIYKRTFFIFFSTESKVSIAPNMLTLIISILYALSIYLRNNISLSDKPKSITINIFNILFLSSLISVIISNEYFYIPIIGEIPFTSQSLCLFFLILSYAGMKSLNIFIFPLLILLSLGRIGVVNKAMGYVGLFYLLFAYISIFLQIIHNNEIIKIYKTSFSEISNDFKFKGNNNQEDNNEINEHLLNNSHNN